MTDSGAGPLPLVFEIDFLPATQIYVRDHLQHLADALDGTPYHDAGQPEQHRFNRHYWHNLPALRRMHHDPTFVAQVGALAGQPLKPSYVFASLYGPDGVCPLHTDRPQCEITVDWLLSSDGNWPLYVEGRPYHLRCGESLLYSGTRQPHFRLPMDSDPVFGTYAHLVFFHFVPVDFDGPLN